MLALWETPPSPPPKRWAGFLYVRPLAALGLRAGLCCGPAFASFPTVSTNRSSESSQVADDIGGALLSLRSGWHGWS
jgi:hypothetical protein